MPKRTPLVFIHRWKAKKTKKKDPLGRRVFICKRCRFVYRQTGMAFAPPEVSCKLSDGRKWVPKKTRKQKERIPFNGPLPRLEDTFMERLGVGGGLWFRQNGTTLAVQRSSDAVTILLHRHDVRKMMKILTTYEKQMFHAYDKKGQPIRGKTSKTSRPRHRNKSTR